MDVWLPFVGSSEKEMIEIFAQLTSVAEPGSAWPVAILPLFGGVTITCIRLLNKNDLGVPLAALNKVSTHVMPKPTCSDYQTPSKRLQALEVRVYSFEQTLSSYTCSLSSS
jgi:hypothetical protein